MGLNGALPSPLEARFHHSVINQFCWGTKGADGKNISIKTYAELAPHLTALWKYSLNNFRLQHSTSYIDPVWQFLIEDIQFFCPSPDLNYRREPKPPSQNTRRNVAFWLGNQIRLYARKRYDPHFVVAKLMSCGLEAELFSRFKESSVTQTSRSQCVMRTSLLITWQELAIFHRFNFADVGVRIGRKGA